MKTAQDVMTNEVVSIDAHAAVAEAVQRMRDLGVGSLLVERVSPSDTWGIISQTDIVQKVMALDKDLSRVEVGEVMTKPVTIVRPDTPLRDCARLMARDHIRRVFVFDGRDIIGVVSASDIFRTL
jgi:signal-transduction protein with cAMP-binding, CBS, and nucleotidyltransferase domain